MFACALPDSATNDATTPAAPANLPLALRARATLSERDSPCQSANIHLAFSAGDDATVRSFHAAALAAGEAPYSDSPAAVRASARSMYMVACTNLRLRKV